MSTIGVLAIQGDFEKHAQVIRTIGHIPFEVRSIDQLEKTEALIIPGGESTTILRLFRKFKFDEALKNYVHKKPIMGTCAGLILLSRDADMLPFKPLGLLDIKVSRNAYGRQRESFIDDIDLFINGESKQFPGVFIRAPKISDIGPSVLILARHNEDAVLVSNKKILAATFHPELSDNNEIHRYFINNFI